MFNDSLKYWFTDNEEAVLEDLTVEVIDPDDNSIQESPILRLTDSFDVTPGWEVYQNSSFTAYIPREDGTGNDKEDIICQSLVGNEDTSEIADLLQIRNTFKGTNGQEYWSTLYLTRLDIDNWETNGHSVYSEILVTLTDTQWRIGNMFVEGPRGGSSYYPMYNSRNVDNSQYNDVSKITLITQSMNKNGDVSGGRYRNNSSA